MASFRTLFTHSNVARPLVVPPGLVACPMGAAVRDTCMQDPRRLAHWPANCIACSETARARSAARRSPAR